MKKAILNIKINVPDDFTIGDCKKCPLNVRSSYESFPGCYCENIECKFGFNKTTCPLEVDVKSDDY